MKSCDESPKRNVKISFEYENEARYFNVVVFKPRDYLLYTKLLLTLIFDTTSEEFAHH
jgi:hypothetical protein